MLSSLRPSQTASPTPRTSVRRTLVSLLVLLVAASPVWAHDWSELTLAYEADEMDTALSATEAVQAALAPHGVPPLPDDAWAVDWWRWFARAARLDERQGQEALREALAAAGFPHAPGDAIAAWRDLLEHLVAASDARRAAAAPPPSDELFEAEPSDAEAADLVRASYVASLQGTASEALPEALRARLDALVAAAGAQP
jgi:hypothetical protein